ncbi:D-alanine--D-alanine ligase, partial [Methylobacterium radiotolerans]
MRERVEALGYPVFVKPANLGSSVTKQVLASIGIPQVPWALAVRREWQRDPAAVRERVEALGYPVFVKPANLGSSV